MQSLRRLSWLALVLAFAQIVFGAIVRITGSGMGCGDHWPKCEGAWFPPLERVDLIIEIIHRYLALGLSIVVVAVMILASSKRNEPGVGGRGGVLRAAGLATALVFSAALLGALTVKLGLNPLIVVAHLTLAMSLLATLVVALSRAGGLGGGTVPAAGLSVSAMEVSAMKVSAMKVSAKPVLAASLRTLRSARIAVGLALATLVLGALTANLPEAASSCTGFPLCRTITADGTALTVHIVHRVIAFLLFGHLLGIVIGVSRRREPARIRRAAYFAFGATVTQVLVAAAMIEMHFPAFLRALHQAIGTLVWLAVVILAIVASRAARTAPEPAVIPLAA